MSMIGELFVLFILLQVVSSIEQDLPYTDILLLVLP